jgi:NAD(P)-dependent dehydrogenase (short-subunit alcohol dehydrogenase family)
MHGYKVINWIFTVFGRPLAAARRMDRLTELADQFGGITPKQVDLSDPGDTEKFCEEISSLPEPVSVLINNAGYSIRGALEDVSTEALRRIFEVNLFSLIRVTQACLPGMRGQRVYSGTKHALEAVTDSLRMEVRPFGIRVITIRPGVIATEFNDVATQMTGDLMARTDPDYKPVYQAAGAGVGGMFAGVTIPGPELIADLILEAVLSDAPKTVYAAGPFVEDILGKRFELDDDGFDRFWSEKTGLTDLKV